MFMSRVRLLLAFVLVLLIGGMIQAQDEVETSVAAELSGAYIVPSESITIEAGEDDTFVVTISGAEETLNWVITQPLMSAGTSQAFDFFENWLASPDELTTEGIIQTEDAVISLTLSAPRFDPEEFTLTFTALAAEATAFDEDAKDGAEIEGTFDGATLYISNTTDFTFGILAGMEERLASTRTSFGSQQCTPGFNCPPYGR